MTKPFVGYTRSIFVQKCFGVINTANKMHLLSPISQDEKKKKKMQQKNTNSSEKESVIEIIMKK